MQTNMHLLQADIDRIVQLGFDREFFCTEQDGWLQLTNDAGRCVFHNGSQCTIYAHRPVGCQLYPVVFDEDSCSGFLDEDCPYHSAFGLSKKTQEGVVALVAQLKQERKQRLHQKSTEKRAR